MTLLSRHTPFAFRLNQEDVFLVDSLVFYTSWYDNHQPTEEYSNDLGNDFDIHLRSESCEGCYCIYSLCAESNSLLLVKRTEKLEGLGKRKVGFWWWL